MFHSWTNAVDIVCWIVVLPVLAWAAYRAFTRSENRLGLIIRTAVSIPTLIFMVYQSHVASGYTPMFVAFPAILLAILWTPALSGFLLRPFLGALTGEGEVAKNKPFYFLAEGHRRKAHYPEAMTEIRKQLAQYPGDYEGCVMLASIHMENLNDIEAAQAVLNEFLAFPNQPAPQVIGALHLLADWHLQYKRDAKGAEAALRRVVELFPGSQAAHAAEQRIARLDSFDEAMRARYEAHYTVRTAGKTPAFLNPQPAPVLPRDLEAEAEALIKKLEEYPSDTETREKLATLFAEDMQRLDLAMEQLEQLIALPVERPKQIAHWLDLLATFHIRCAQDQEAAAQALRRIVDRFPGSPLAAQAEMRLGGLGGEIKGFQPTEVKRMDPREKTLGLRRVRK